MRAIGSRQHRGAMAAAEDLVDTPFVRALAGVSVEPVLTTTATGMISSINPAAVRTLGYPCDQTVGRHVSMLSRDGGDGALSHAVADAATGTGTEALATALWTRCGARIDVLACVTPLHDAAGELLGALVVVRSGELG